MRSDGEARRLRLAQPEPGADSDRDCEPFVSVAEQRRHLLDRQR